MKWQAAVLTIVLGLLSASNAVSNTLIQDLKELNVSSESDLNQAFLLIEHATDRLLEADDDKLLEAVLLLLAQTYKFDSNHFSHEHAYQYFSKNDDHVLGLAKEILDQESYIIFKINFRTIAREQKEGNG